MRTILLAAIVLLPFCAWAAEPAAPAEPELWIEGLTLPADSRIVEGGREELLFDTPGSAAQYDIFDEFTEAALLGVSFDSALEWDAVREHIAAALAPAGYLPFRSERMARRLMARGISRADAERKTGWVFEQSDGIAGGASEEFAAAGSHYYVTLSDMGEANQQAQRLAAAFSAAYAEKSPDLPPLAELPETGRYLLMVIRLKEPYPADLAPQPEAASAGADEGTGSPDPCCRRVCCMTD